MRRINLQEYATSEYWLSVTERDDLKRELPSLAVENKVGEEDVYLLKPGSTVGAVEIGDLSVLIQPKMGIPQLLSLACYATGVVKLHRLRQFDFREETALPDTLALALTSAARQAFRRGLLRGYRTEEEALYTVRGRIRFDEQLRRRFGVSLPVEVRYDEFTEDILTNRVVKAAALRLGGMRLRSQAARSGLGWIAGMLNQVSLVEFPPGEVPAVTFDRLNDHYRGVVELSRLILRHSAFESDRGRVRASGFLMNMNVLFQEFVTQALREALMVSDRTLRSDRGLPTMTLDEAGRVKLEPDLSWWEGGVCRFVGDAKYKRVSDGHVPNADLYQLLAYATALDLPGGMLIYAKGEAETVVHKVKHSGKRLEIAALDLSGTLDAIIAQIRGLADRIIEFRNEARKIPHAA